MFAPLQLFMMFILFICCLVSLLLACSPMLYVFHEFTNSSFYDGVRIAHRFSLLLTCSAMLSVFLEFTPSQCLLGSVLPICLGCSWIVDQCSMCLLSSSRFKVIGILLYILYHCYLTWRSMLWIPLRFKYKNDVRFVSTPGGLYDEWFPFFFLYVMVSNTSCLYEQPCGCHLRAPWFTPVLSEIRVAHHSSVLCAACVLLVFILCVLCPMLPVSPDFPFLNAASGFSNVYVGGFNQVMILLERLMFSFTRRRWH
jgi:hypothetical protein